MTKERALGIGVALFAAMLLAAAAMQMSFAQEPPAGIHATGNPGTPATPNDSGPPSAGDDLHAGAVSDQRPPGETGDASKAQNNAGAGQSGAEAEGAGGKQDGKGSAAPREITTVPGRERAGTTDNNPAKPRAPDASPIDTRITVQPRRPIGTANQAPSGKKAFKLVTPGKYPALRPPVPGASNSISRSAIGLPVTARNAERGPYSAVPGPAAARSTSAPASLVGRFASGGTVVGQRSLAAPNARLAATGLPGARIDGAAMVRPVTAAPILGGPAKPVVAGISGTMVRPKR
jgi:hypothetical protein